MFTLVRLCKVCKIGKYRDTVSVEPGSKPFLARYRSRRANFYVSWELKILFPYTKDTLNVSDESRYCIGVGVADTYFLYRDQPCQIRFESRRPCSSCACSSSSLAAAIAPASSQTRCRTPHPEKEQSHSEVRVKVNITTQHSSQG